MTAVQRRTARSGHCSAGPTQIGRDALLCLLARRNLTKIRGRRSERLRFCDDADIPNSPASTGVQSAGAGTQRRRSRAGAVPLEFVKVAARASRSESCRVANRAKVRLVNNASNGSELCCRYGTLAGIFTGRGNRAPRPDDQCAILIDGISARSATRYRVYGM